MWEDERRQEDGDRFELNLSFQRDSIQGIVSQFI